MKHLPRSVKLVAFDLDGTVVDAYQALADSINYLMKEMGLPSKSLRTIKRSVGWGVGSLIRCFVEEELVDKALAIFRKHHDQRLHQGIKLMPGTVKLLEALKSRGCILAIASNRPSNFCRIILKELQIDQYFDLVICGDSVKRPKPYPDVLKAILKEAGVKPSQAVYVGDMTVDVLCGRRARVFTIALPTGSCSRKELQSIKPDIILPGLRAVGQKLLLKAG